MSLVKVLILPPGCFFLLGLVGLLVMRRRRRTGRGILLAALVGLYLATTPLVASMLLRSLETAPAWTADRTDPAAGAIVVLSADLERLAPEYGGPHVGELTLQRARYGAWLHRRTGLPLLVTGGRLERVAEPAGSMMRRLLEEEFGVPVRWVEQGAGNTWGNALGARELLEAAGIRRVYLVTHAWHMPRALAAFEAAGLEPVPAPTVFRARAKALPTEVLPSSKALRETALALHEWIGRLWYGLAHRAPPDPGS